MMGFNFTHSGPKFCAHQSFFSVVPCAAFVSFGLTIASLYLPIQLHFIMRFSECNGRYNTGIAGCNSPLVLFIVCWHWAGLTLLGTSFTIILHFISKPAINLQHLCSLSFNLHTPMFQLLLWSEYHHPSTPLFVLPNAREPNPWSSLFKFKSLCESCRLLILRPLQMHTETENNRPNLRFCAKDGSPIYTHMNAHTNVFINLNVRVPL